MAKTQYSFSHDASATVAMVRAADPDIPVVVGFGVSNRGHVQELAKQADGVVVGSAIVKALGDGGVDKMGALVADLAQGLKKPAGSAGAGEPPAKRQRTGNDHAFDTPQDKSEVAKWKFGTFGGRYIPETLMHAHEELEKCYALAKQDPTFHAE